MPSLIVDLSFSDLDAELSLICTPYFGEIPLVVHWSDYACGTKNASITFATGEKYEVQLKDNEIDPTINALAQSLLGFVVPNMQKVPTKSVHHAYIVDLPQGSIWDPSTLSIEENRIVASQVGALLSNCMLEMDSASMIDRYVIPRLKRILRRPKGVPKAVKAAVERLLNDGSIEKLKVLPMELSRADVNLINIIISDDPSRQVTGLLEWQYARFLPVGMAASAVRGFSTLNSSGTELEMEWTKPIAIAFWRSFIEGLSDQIPPEHHSLLITSMQVGFIMNRYLEGTEASTKQFEEQMIWFEEIFEPLC